MSKLRGKYQRGDTLIEVLFGIVIFSLVAVIAITTMNKGLATAQTSLEIEMARNEIDAQAEALRFLQNSFVAERELQESQQNYVKLWRYMVTEFGNDPMDAETKDYFKATSCEQLYVMGNPGSIPSNRGFVLNTRLLQPSHTRLDFDEINDILGASDSNYSTLMREMIVKSVGDSGVNGNYKFQPTPIEPRVIYSYTGFTNDFDAGSSAEGSYDESTEGRLYRLVKRVEGIWVVAVRGGKMYTFNNMVQPEYYDFHVRTCWTGIDRINPLTIGTIVRLYNPEIIQSQPGQQEDEEP